MVHRVQGVDRTCTLERNSRRRMATALRENMPQHAERRGVVSIERDRPAKRGFRSRPVPIEPELGIWTNKLSIYADNESGVADIRVIF